MSYGTYRKIIGGAIQWQLHGDEICFFVFAFMRTLVSYIIVSECVTGVLFTLLKYSHVMAADADCFFRLEKFP